MGILIPQGEIELTVHFFALLFFFTVAEPMLQAKVIKASTTSSRIDVKVRYYSFPCNMD